MKELYQKLIGALLNNVPFIEVTHGADKYTLRRLPNQWCELKLNNKIKATGYSNLMHRRLKQLAVF